MAGGRSGESMARNSEGLSAYPQFLRKNSHVSRDRLWIIKRVYPFQFAVTNLHAVEDLIHAMDCLHFKNRGDIFSLNNVLLDLSAFDGWQNTCQESDYGVPPA